MFRFGISAVGPGVGLLIAVALRERDLVRTFDLRNGVVVPLAFIAGGSVLMAVSWYRSGLINRAPIGKVAE